MRVYTHETAYSYKGIDLQLKKIYESHKDVIIYGIVTGNDCYTIHYSYDDHFTLDETIQTEEE